MSLPPTRGFDHGDETDPFAKPPSRTPNTGAWIILGAAVILLVIVIAVVVGTGGSDDPVAAPPVTVTVAPSTTSTTPPPTTSSTPDVPRSTSATSGEGIMPQVVCMNLQAAQDLIQRSGVFYSRSRDATGAGRAQIFDRNWIVVAQSPAAGARIGEGDAVLSVVKNDEPNPC
ncbi:PASTA domain-containing protein [Williamsia sp. MIQD14]|uniref:PASTA domain-containing protein n=1 Tax=Williamsia sp. MIQD14 TaxID=3425703 RepID=UPI003DA1452F